MKEKWLVLLFVILFLGGVVTLAQAQIPCPIKCVREECEAICSGGTAIPTSAPTSPPEATPGPPGGGGGGGGTPVPPGTPPPDVTPFPTPTPPQDRVCADEWFRCRCFSPNSLAHSLEFAYVRLPSCPPATRRGGCQSSCQGGSWYDYELVVCDVEDVPEIFFWMVKNIKCSEQECEPPCATPTPPPTSCDSVFQTPWIDWRVCAGNWVLVARARIPGIAVGQNPYPALVHEPVTLLFTPVDDSWHWSTGGQNGTGYVDDWNPWNWSYEPQVCDSRPDGNRCFPKWRRFRVGLKWIQAGSDTPEPPPARYHINWDERPWGEPKEESLNFDLAQHVYVTSSAGKGCRDSEGRDAYCVGLTSYWRLLAQFEVYHNDCVEWGEIKRCCPCSEEDIERNLCKNECSTPDGTPGYNCPLSYCKKRACEQAGNCNTSSVDGWSRQSRLYEIDLRTLGQPHYYAVYNQTHPLPVREVQDVITRPGR